MEHLDRIRICERCKNRKVNPQIGMICGLSDQVATFEGSCDFFQVDGVLDFQMRMMEENAARNKQNTKRIKLFMLVGLPLICLLGFGAHKGVEWWQDHQVETAAERWALLLEEDIEENAGEGLVKRIDLYQVLNRATHDGKKSAQIVSYTSENLGLKQALASMITRNYSSGIHVKHLNINIQDQRAFILYRISYPSALVDYLEIELKEVDGELKIVDAFSFLKGEYMNETLYSMLPRDDYSLPGSYNPYQFYRSIGASYEASKLIAQRNTISSLNVLNSISDKLKKEKFYLISEAEYFQKTNPQLAIDSYNNLLKKSQDIRFQAYIKLLQMSNGAPNTEFNKTIATLKKYIGNDAYLDFLAIKARRKNSSCEEFKELHNELAREIYYLDAKLACEVEAKNYEEAKKLLTK